MTGEQRETLLNWAKTLAVLIPALSGAVLGSIGYFREAKDPYAKSGYTELARQVEGLNKDAAHLSEVVKLQQDSIKALTTFLLSAWNATEPGISRAEVEHHGEIGAKAEQVLQRVSKAATPKAPALRPRKAPPKWEQLQRAE